MEGYSFSKQREAIKSIYDAAGVFMPTDPKFFGNVDPTTIDVVQGTDGIPKVMYTPYEYRDGVPVKMSRQEELTVCLPPRFVLAGLPS